jgi:hypothetical protein
MFDYFTFLPNEIENRIYSYVDFYSEGRKQTMEELQTCFDGLYTPELIHYLDNDIYDNYLSQESKHRMYRHLVSGLSDPVRKIKKILGGVSIRYLLESANSLHLNHLWYKCASTRCHGYYH